MTSRFGRGGDRGTARGKTDGRNALVCPSCGLKNDPSARFCRNCGLPLGWPQDPVRGTTTRRADLPSERGAGVASIIGLLAAVGVLVVAGYLVLRGSGTGTPGATHTASPRPTTIALGSPGASPSALSSIGPSGGASPSPAISDTPSQPVTEPPGSFPATIDFTCDQATIGDPTQGHWKVHSVTSQTSSGYDRVIVSLTRDGESIRSGTISVETVTLDEVSARYGMPAPHNVDRALVVTFERRVNGFPAPPQATGMLVIRNFEMNLGSDGLWHLVLGQVGDGCHRIGVPNWDNNPTATSAELLIDVKK